MSTLKTDVLKDVAETVTVNVVDIIGAINFPQELSNSADDTKGAALIGYEGTTVRAVIRRQITPEDHGAVGDGVADDKAAIIAAMQDAASSNSLFVARGNYALAGSAAVTGLARLDLDVRGARFKQLTTFSKTLSFTASSNIHITGGEFTGLGVAGGEFNGVSTSYNGVAAVHFEDCFDVSVEFAEVVDHAGGGIIAHDTKGFRAHNNKVVGIGTAGIAGGENGSDFGIACWSDDITVYADTGLVADISHNDVSGHAFGLFGNRFKSFIAQGNYIHDIPGQHGIYIIEASGVSINGNVFKSCFLHATKMNLENYVDNLLAPAGNINLFGFTWCDNVALNCGDGLNINSTSLSDNTEQLLFGLKVSGNVVRNCSQDGLIIMRSVGEVCDNHITVTTRYGIQIRNSKLKVSWNNVANAGACGMLSSWYHDSEVQYNTFRDCGLNSLVGATGQWPVYMNTTTLGLPSQPATARVNFEGNSIQFTTGDAVAANIALTESRYVMAVVGVRTNSLKTFRVDGSLEYGIHNEFAGFSAGTISNPATFLKGQMSRDFYGQQNPQAAGSTDAFIRGDRCWNSAPGASVTPGWICVTAGSPGVWKAMAVLAA